VGAFVQTSRIRACEVVIAGTVTVSFRAVAAAVLREMANVEPPSVLSRTSTRSAAVRFVVHATVCVVPCPQTTPVPGEDTCRNAGAMVKFTLLASITVPVAALTWMRTRFESGPVTVQTYRPAVDVALGTEAAIVSTAAIEPSVARISFPA